MLVRVQETPCRLRLMVVVVLAMAVVRVLLCHYPVEYQRCQRQERTTCPIKSSRSCLHGSRESVLGRVDANHRLPVRLEVAHVIGKPRSHFFATVARHCSLCNPSCLHIAQTSPIRHPNAGARLDAPHPRASMEVAVKDAWEAVWRAAGEAAWEAA